MRRERHSRHAGPEALARLSWSVSKAELEAIAEAVGLRASMSLKAPFQVTAKACPTSLPSGHNTSSSESLSLL